MQKYKLQKKILSKETKIPQDIINLQLISQVSTKPKISSFKNPLIKIELLLLYDQSKHNILCLVGKGQQQRETYSRVKDTKENLLLHT
jgi:hypothetical protein